MTHAPPNRVSHRIITKAQKRFPRRSKGGAAGTAVLCLAMFARTGEAQQVLTPPPIYGVTPPAMQEYETNQPGAPQVNQLASVNGGEQPLFQAGPVAIHPHLLYRFLYGNGIQATPGQQKNTAINQISPGVLFAIGSHWTLDYTPTLSYYSSSHFRDTLDQSAGLRWGTLYQDWVFGISQSYTAISAPLAQTGTQTDTENYSTAGNVSYRFNSKISADFSIGQNFVFAQQFTSTREWTTMNWLNYQLWTKVDIGAGAGFDYYDVSPGPNVMDEQLQGRVRWRLTDKTSFAIHAGVQDQQYLMSGTGNRISPIFGASLEYGPIEGTVLSLSADRSVAPSFFEGQVVEATTVSAGLSQRILKKLNLGLTGSYGKSRYLASASNVFPNRVDDYYAFGARLSTVVLKRGTASIFYQYSDNSSTIPGFTYKSSQVGFELGCQF